MCPFLNSRQQLQNGCRDAIEAVADYKLAVQAAVPFSDSGWMKAPALDAIGLRRALETVANFFQALNFVRKPFTAGVQVAAHAR